MNFVVERLEEEQIKLLVDDNEISPMESLQSLVLKILHKVGKPLHIEDIESVILRKGYFQAHNKEIPVVVSRSITPVLRRDKGIYKISKGVYGVYESKNTEITKENCPNCEKKIHRKRHFCPYCSSNLTSSFNFSGNLLDIKRHFCPYCGADLNCPCCGINLVYN
ncbi:hypothetical protein [Methanosarcina sp. 1.H.A.2.2]|uniref:hypothetical protein n=1 Tax=Methanosarcina sp. 1.H.A.2.2 TaxID=1483601 RepID=UPI000621591C|nr:hypothetical protein [Methanosarcina sp. 1.H.A.2.2]KKH47538.1 hypothetical protein EO93_01455 [Methanosarcina sp. 1.H.A.2.2]